ncbi:MAG TPA: glucose 1-dehydrogenase [Verrucomicrobiae bacterium]|nr:glucose 1-dehydrogenase [Verrucomicrobiae bacterium]
MKGLGGKRALVTGASSGLGRAIAVRLFQEGCSVGINYLDCREEGEETERIAHDAPKLGDGKAGKEPGTVVIQADISSEQEVRRMIGTAIREMGGLDILVNNAGIQVSKASHEVEMPEFDSVLNVNLRGTFMCSREAIHHFLATRAAGVVINVSSVHQIVPKPKYIGYSASRGAMGALTHTLALEYADRGIRVNAVAPGATATPINRSWAEDPKKLEEVMRHIPLGRAGTAEEMAAATAFLCSDEASYITGQTLYVDGGLTLYADFRTAWSSE